MYERIRNLREDHDLKQEDIARLLHCTQACYSNYETGKRDIPTEVLHTLADFYHVSIDYLLGRTGRKEPYPNNRPRQRQPAGDFSVYAAPTDILCGIFFVSRPPTAHFFAAGIPWNERQSSKFDIGGNFYVQQQRSVRLPEQQLVVDRYSDPPAVQLRWLERLREQQ